MPRSYRLDSEGCLQHVMVRGIEKRTIFRTDTDRESFIDRIAVVTPDTGTSMYAWSLMPNHFHLLLRSGSAGLSTLMRRLLTGYAVNFNRRHKRSGHLFQNRYRSIVVEENQYFLEMVRYIHLNPLRSGLVKSLGGLDRFPWSGHAVIMGHRDAAWQDVGYVLQQFTGSMMRTRQAYRQFVAEGAKQGKRSELSGGGLIRSIGGPGKLAEFRNSRERWSSDQRALGSGEFVRQVTKEAGSGAGKQVKPADQEKALTKLLEELSKMYGVETREVMGSSRRQEVSSVRAALSYIAVTKLGISLTRVAGFLEVSIPGVKQALERGKNRLESLEVDVGKLTEAIAGSVAKVIAGAGSIVFR